MFTENMIGFKIKNLTNIAKIHLFSFIIMPLIITCKIKFFLYSCQLYFFCFVFLFWLLLSDYTLDLQNSKFFHLNQTVIQAFGFIHSNYIYELCAFSNRRIIKKFEFEWFESLDVWITFVTSVILWNNFQFKYYNLHH